MWNPFRKSAQAKAEDPEPEEEPKKPPAQMLPAVNGREDTRRVSTTLLELRRKREAAAEALEETAEEVREEAAKTSHTLRSMPMFVIPGAAKVGVGE